MGVHSGSSLATGRVASSTAPARCSGLTLAWSGRPPGGGKGHTRRLARVTSRRPLLPWGSPPSHWGRSLAPWRPTFLAPAPASTVRLGGVAAGVPLEGAGPGQRRRLRPGQSGQEHNGPKEPDASRAAPGLRSPRAGAGAAHFSMCGRSFPTVSGSLPAEKSSSNCASEAALFVCASLSRVSGRHG